MPRYRWNPETSQVEEVTEYGERHAPQPFQIMRDLPAYKSPLGDGVVVDGRAARREHLKRNGCREVEPGEWKRGFRNPHFAAKRGLPVTQD
jgi:hypothetical protein